MTYPINVNIPGTNNDPADDQPLMQTNFSNINSYLQVDHTNPAATGAGQHKQVTFNSNNVPTTPTVPPVLFTNIQDGNGNNLPSAIPELFYYSGSSAQSSGQYTSKQNGSVLLFGGIIMKWGLGAITNASQTFVSLGIPSFPNACFMMVVTSTDAALGSPLKVTAVTPTAFTVTRSGSGNTGYNFIAIGN